MTDKAVDVLALTVVVPLFNEARRPFGDHVEQIGAFVAAQPAGSELLLVDDGSSDGTVEAVAAFLAARPELHARLIRRPHQGKGAAVRAGLEEARSALTGLWELSPPTPLGDFARLVDAARRDGGVVIGSRDPAGSEMVEGESSLRETLGKACDRAVRTLLVDGVSHTECGAMVAPTAVWRRILPHCAENGPAWDVEVLAIAGALQIPLADKEVSAARDDGSGVHGLRDGVAMLCSLPRIRRRVRTARYRSASRTS